MRQRHGLATSAAHDQAHIRHATCRWASQGATPRGRALAQDGGSRRIRIRRDLQPRQLTGRETSKYFDWEEINSGNVKRRRSHARAIHRTQDGSDTIFAASTTIALARRLRVAHGSHGHFRAHGRSVHAVHCRPHGKGQDQQGCREPTNQIEQHGCNIATSDAECQRHLIPTPNSRSILVETPCATI